MSDNLLQTKLHIPVVRARMVSRPRLTNRLIEGIDGKLSLVSAPAGSGKTTLICDFIGKINRPVAWISLDSGDNDPIRLFKYFIAAIRTINPEMGDKAESVLESGKSPQLETSATILLTDIADLAQKSVLVLDDYHAIKSDQIHSILSFILENLPSCLHIVITTRTNPPLPVSRFRARG